MCEYCAGDRRVAFRRVRASALAVVSAEAIFFRKMRSDVRRAANTCFESHHARATPDTLLGYGSYTTGAYGRVLAVLLPQRIKPVQPDDKKIMVKSKVNLVFIL